MRNGKKLLTKKYDDSKFGAVQMLKEMSVFDLRRAKVVPDQSVEGVWKVTICSGKFKGVEVIAYLAGYLDPFGHLREFNDFEDCF